MANKPVFPAGPTLVWRDDNTFEDTEQILVTGLVADGEAARKHEAILKANRTPGTLHPVATLAAALVRVRMVTVQLLSDDRALVTVSWGISDTPILDGAWVYECFSEQIRESRGYDCKDDGSVNNAIRIQYANETILAGVADLDFFLGPGGRYYRRGATVSGYNNIVHVVGRRHISREGVAGGAGMVPMEPHPTIWPAKYVNHVNKAKVVFGDPDGPGSLIEGEWLCRSVRISTRNQYKSFLIEAEFVWRVDGWEEFLWFHDKQGLIPSDIVIPAGMKLPWPTERLHNDIPDDRPYGVIRPQTLKGPLNFNAAPFSFQLGGWAR